MKLQYLVVPILLFALATSAVATPRERAFVLTGFYPTAGLISDGAGNLYGTTNFGGKYVNNGVSGTVFELSPTKNGRFVQKVIFNFSGGSDGGYPYSSLVMDTKGNLYGTASEGGNLTACSNGCGVVFELVPQSDGTWTETILHAFAGSDGETPLGPVTFDAKGNLYGTTSDGGAPGSNCWNGCGYVFKLTPQSVGGWGFKNIYSFQGNEDAGNPLSQLVLDHKGNLFGTAGWDVIFPEVVFKLSPAAGEWKFQLLQSFLGCPTCDTFGVLSGVTFDKKGNLYGTVPINGTYGAGTFYKLAPATGLWKLTVLHEFTNGPDGGFPFAAPIFDSKGNMYGTTSGGGLQNGNCSDFGCGVIYKLTPRGHQGWSRKVLYTFKGGHDGASPEAGLLLDQSGNLWGTTYFGNDAFDLAP